MKKIILTAIASLMALCASAQAFEIGGRVDGGVQAVANVFLGSKHYVELRAGANVDYTNFDLTGLFQWQLLKFGSRGNFFFDAGAGFNMGAASKGHFGIAGDAKVGIKFKAPVKLSIDYSPVIGWRWGYQKHGKFFTPGLYKFGISCVYCF